MTEHSRPGLRKEGGAHRVRNIPKSGPPCSFLPVPSSCEGKSRLWELVAEGGSNERAKNDDPQLIVAVKLSEDFFSLFHFLVGGQEAPRLEIRGFPPRTRLVRDVHFKG